MKVLLAAAPNPDIEGGYWSPGRRPRPQWVNVCDLAEARERCINFIVSNDLGGGNWAGGDVQDDSGKPVAYVSYNGRVWRGRESHEELSCARPFSAN
jgi:hypothetical protein